MTTQTPDVYDQIAELARPHTTRAAYEITRGQTTYHLHHTVRVPSLLRQLEWVAPTGRGDDRTSGGYESRPAAALEALNVLAEVDRRATWWLRILGVSDWGEPDEVLRRLAAQIRGLEQHACHRTRLTRDDQDRPCCRYHHAAADVRRWWTQARVATGWDSPAWRPDNTCPMCGERGGLRVKEADKIGFCVECHETWSPESIGLLAEHIRGENAEDRRRQVELVVCWCAWPQPVFERWPALCPACGSRYCHRAVTAERMAG